MISSHGWCSLQRPGTDCDGKHKGERFFKCPVGFGLYVPLEDVKVIAPEAGLEKDADFDLEEELKGLIGMDEVSPQ